LGNAGHGCNGDSNSWPSGGRGLRELESAAGSLPPYEHLAWYQSLESHLRERRRGTPGQPVPPERTSHVTPTGSRLGTLVEISETIEYMVKQWKFE
jgi:hypothetical protein